MFTHVTDTGQEIVVRIPESKTYTAKLFPILSKTSIGIIRRYIALRPTNSPTARFFILQRGNRCFGQPIGKNTIALMPRRIASFLNLENPNSYTGHSFRRSSTTMAADAGATLEEMKRFYYWKSNTVVESKSWYFAANLFLHVFYDLILGYIGDSIGQKRITAGSISKALDLDSGEVRSKIARLSSDDEIATNVAALEVEQTTNVSIIAIDHAAIETVVNIQNEDNSNAVVDNFADDDKENFVGENIASIALSQSVCKKEKKVEQHSIKLSNCKYFTIKFGNCSK